MTKMEILQNKINDKNLSIDEREDRFLDLQILELNENERQENRYIQQILKHKDYVFENLNNEDFTFLFFEEENDTFGNYNCLINVKTQKTNLLIKNIHYFDDYSNVNLMTKEEINILKEYQKEKNQKNNEDDEESEF
jgi:hypothetical protein